VRRENLELHKERVHPENDMDDDSVSMQESFNAEQSESGTETTTEASADKSESETETRTEASDDRSDVETEASADESDSETDEESHESLLRETMTSAHLEVRAQAEYLSYDAYLETVRNVFIEKYSTMLSQQNLLDESEIHGKVQATIERLMDREDYSTQEATRYALHKRRYLFDELLLELNPAGGGDADSSD